MSNVLITGANSGFGLLTARKFAEAGHTVHAGYRAESRAGDLRALARELPLVRPVQLDVTDQSLVDSAVAEACAAGPIDVLVNNAGFEVSCPVDALSDEVLQRQFDTNVFGVVRMIRAVAPGMRERKQGAIINLSSIVGWLTVPYGAAYAATKHAVESLSEGLWYELAPFGIRIAVVEPGVFPTPFHSNVVTATEFDENSPHWANAERYRGAMRPTMDGVKSDPQEVADLVFEAATTATPKFRYAAGADARAFIPAYKSMEFEAFSQALLTRGGLADWAAPA
ncbi:SDR family oxidoreductase [Polymorphobacter sp. PAMC 29334]|uniref:SDR family oxidoreductase n=1 Tax=Polymorphobacter sp. PAMC 29334 TaxID=2862331 RepID=UPI001C687260|nr:SDR family oxidoreductase [Polymorphobacter sp. PAMC 29334]QYE36407.1 SDR family oxidoreductase [Polymorphobacter sp. PAMC 29334]